MKGRKSCEDLTNESTYLTMPENKLNKKNFSVKTF